MKILVANIGSTSFKFRLFDFAGGQRELAAGGIDRIGGAGGTLTFALTGRDPVRRGCACADHGEAVRAAMDEMAAASVLADAADLSAVAFKAITAGEADPVAIVDDAILAAMERLAPIAPAHNPPYVAAMRRFRDMLPDTPLVAAFEPGFHRTVPRRRRLYACPPAWESEFGIRRYGYHGASLRYIAERTAELSAGKARRIVACHLGGSSSLCAIRDGKSVATTMGYSAQSGLPQGTRCGDFDPFALAIVAAETGKTLDAMLAELAGEAGLAAMSGVGADMRDIESAAEAGDGRAQLTIDVYVTAIRDYLGAYLVELGGADAIVFTGGIGQNSPLIRERVCKGLDFAGIALDDGKNAAAEGECRIDRDGSPTAIWVMPTNEEKIVSRLAAELLGSQKGGSEDE
ncbi:MAG TPA: acetate/propionate family kinase [Phycisphaerae bacterium]|nr:acetate/propionate family kinase [Phycisphaerae bacterium]